MSDQRPAYLLDLPLSPYPEILALQRDCVAARHSRCLDQDLVIMVEHTPVFTLGRRGGLENLLASEAMLAARGISVIPVERGGDITYHGPGQLVVYPILSLSAARMTVVALVDALENAMVRTAAQWGVQARGDNARRGAWVETRKLGSVGITIRRSVSFHGLALNVNTDLTPFSWINPCGIPHCTMTSLAVESGRQLPMAAVRRQLGEHLAALLDLRLEPVALTSIMSLIPAGQRNSSVDSRPID